MKYSLNLSSTAYVNRRALFGGYTLLALLLLGLLVMNVANLWRSLERTAQVERQRGELLGKGESAARGAADPRESQHLAKEITFANELLERDSYRWTTLLSQLEAHLVDGVGIRGLDPDFKKGILHISGVAESLPALRRFLDRLANSAEFEAVYLNQQARESREDGEGEQISFDIALKRRGA